MTLPPLQEWPGKWRPVVDEASDADLQREWRELRRFYPEVAPTVVGELCRELRPTRLQAADFRLLAWDAGNSKEYLFATNHPEAPVFMAHLTWQAGSKPFGRVYASVAEFIKREEEYLRKRVQDWLTDALARLFWMDKSDLEDEKVTVLALRWDEERDRIELGPEAAFLSMCALPDQLEVPVPEAFFKPLQLVGLVLDWEKKRGGTPWERVRPWVRPAP